MKRGGAEVDPAHLSLIWSGCGGLLNEVAVADVKRSRRGNARPTMPCQDEPDGIGSAMLARPLGASHHAMLACASLWAVVCGPGGVWPCGGVWPRKMRVEG